MSHTFQFQPRQEGEGGQKKRYVLKLLLQCVWQNGKHGKAHRELDVQFEKISKDYTRNLLEQL